MAGLNLTLVELQDEYDDQPSEGHSDHEEQTGQETQQQTDAQRPKSLRIQTGLEDYQLTKNRDKRISKDVKLW